MKINFNRFLDIFEELYDEIIKETPKVYKFKRH